MISAWGASDDSAELTVAVATNVLPVFERIADEFQVVIMVAMSFVGLFLAS